MLLAASVGLLLVSAPGATPPTYIDPTGGGLLLQIVLGGTAGMLVLGRILWRNVTSVFRRDRKEPADTPDGTPPQAQ